LTESYVENTATQGHGSPKLGDHDKLLRNYDNLMSESEQLHRRSESVNKHTFDEDIVSNKYNIVVGKDRRTMLVNSQMQGKTAILENVGQNTTTDHNISPEYATTTMPDQTESPNILSKSYLEKNCEDEKVKNEITIFD
jgi:hypothetical protein